MNSQLNFFAYSAGYLDAMNERPAQRPDNAHYMTGYRDGVKTVQESEDRCAGRIMVHAARVDAGS